MGICHKTTRSRSIHTDIDLQNATFKNTPKYLPNITSCRVLKVYDGDSITIASRIENKIWKWSVRLNGIDTPEIRSKDEYEKTIADIAKKQLENILMPFGVSSMIQIKVLSYGKYGRLLAEIYKDDVHINKLMLDKRLAVPYDGGTKQNIAWYAYYNGSINLY
uniref:Nuclease-like protein n=1 Tax=Mimivirus LCMiAC01 TaxID=2506608 RepID=A0A481YZY1_9VIRU|nr:MAG: nuclease-like protein [Mimivirus LCMiAC01]